MSNRKYIDRSRCPGHPSRKLEEGKRHCRLCTKQAKQRAKRRIERIKSAEVCYKHPDRKITKGSMRCSECLLDIRLWHLKRKGLPQEELDKAKTAFEKHDDRCEGCGSSDPGIRGWCIDHDHKTKKFRGILCTRCNVALGMVFDNLLILRALQIYLDKTTPAVLASQNEKTTRNSKRSVASARDAVRRAAGTKGKAPKGAL